MQNKNNSKPGIQKRKFQIQLIILILFFYPLVISAQSDITVIIQEDQTDAISYDGNIDTKHTGFTGSGFIDTENDFGQGITYDLCIQETDTYALQWRYAHEKEDNRIAKVMVDGKTVIDSVHFPPTGGWTAWDTTTSVFVFFESGTYKLKLEAITSQGLANNDYLSITGKNASAGFCPVSVTGIDLPSSDTVGVKGVKRLTTVFSPSNATNKHVTWESSDTSIVTVNAMGLLTGIKTGSALITVTTEEGGFKDSCTVTSIKVPLVNLSTMVTGQGNVLPESDSFAIGHTVCVQAIPASGWFFDAWSGDTTTAENPICITMDSGKSVTANFTEASYEEIIPDGYAGYKGTTGGGNAAPVTVSSASEFIAAINSNDPAVIIISGFLNVGTIGIGSNKTLLGIDSNAGLYGGTIKLQGSNYIVKNLTFGPSSEDVMELSGATKAFITKCTFHDAGDEILSIVRESDYVTVSWCKFYFDNTHSHAFGHLIGNSDDRTSDRGKLHVTMHHNWYSKGIRGRQPRVRYGHVHIYNNYYNSVGSGYCIGVGYECHIRVENTHFDRVSSPWADYGGVENGEIGWIHSKFEGTSQPGFVKNSFPVFDLPYDYTLDPVDSVKSRVLAGAGNVFKTEETSNTIQVAVTSPSNNAEFEYNSSITIEAEATATEGSIDSVEFFHNYKRIGVSVNEPFSVDWLDVTDGNYKLTALAYDKHGQSTFSDFIDIEVKANKVISVDEPDKGSINIYPNPTSAELIISYENEIFKNTILSIINSHGRIIAEKQLTQNDFTLDISSIPNGIYIVSVKYSQGTIIKKFIKE